MLREQYLSASRLVFNDTYLCQYNTLNATNANWDKERGWLNKMNENSDQNDAQNAVPMTKILLP